MDSCWDTDEVVMFRFTNPAKRPIMQISSGLSPDDRRDSNGSKEGDRAETLGAFGRYERGAPGLTTRSKKLGAKGIATRSKDATRDSWPYY